MLTPRPRQNHGFDGKALWFSNHRCRRASGDLPDQIPGYLRSDTGETMPKMLKKSELPTKVCATCGLPFTWRKKWERDWDAVRFCSDRCRKGAAKRKGRADPR